jgi:hypothetical protein
MEQYFEVETIAEELPPPWLATRTNMRIVKIPGSNSRRKCLGEEV